MTRARKLGLLIGLLIAAKVAWDLARLWRDLTFDAEDLS